MAVNILALVTLGSLVYASGATLMKCSDNGQIHNIGELYISNGCDMCTCKPEGPDCHRGVLCLGKREEQRNEARNGGECITHGVGHTYVSGCDICMCEAAGPKCDVGKLCTLGRRQQRLLTETKPCVVNGKTYQPGETFSDGCNTCACDKWGPICTAMFCGGGGPLRRDVVSDPLVDKRLISDDTCSHNGKTYAKGKSYLTYVGEKDQICRCYGHNGWSCYFIN